MALSLSALFSKAFGALITVRIEAPAVATAPYADAAVGTTVIDDVATAASPMGDTQLGTAPFAGDGIPD